MAIRDTAARLVASGAMSDPPAEVRELGSSLPT
jgi:hypothetical protein